MSAQYFSFNGTRTVLVCGITIADLVADNVAPSSGCAVARNGEVVPRSVWMHVVIVEEDVIELLTAAQGG